MYLHLRIAAALFVAGLYAPHAARAAESYDNCSGFIDTVPATISTQGVWCLRKDLATNIASGKAITIATNNVTIDCNDFKLGGLAAGDASQALGIYASGRQNAAVRHCNVRGFYTGIHLSGGAGHLVEDNRLDNNLVYGIYVNGESSMIRRNRVLATGGSTLPPASIPSITGILAIANSDVRENAVDGVFGIDSTDVVVYGIRLGGAAPGYCRVSGNRVRDLLPSSASTVYGIYSSTNARIYLDDNRVALSGSVAGSQAYRCYGSSYASLRNSTAWGFADSGIGTSCRDDGGNVAH